MSLPLKTGENLKEIKETIPRRDMWSKYVDFKVRPM